ncbi:hypothetical protein HG537_0E05130 [Torulaspora globosa]|uniref:Uncharacterized protein n=1 Tax=Torulaspora globosa TaxID=48254 RepID=A0A7H9HTU7_9SACH|nr:hypothetical protein HG537_0E05130 [Torulaspora sp. CBS 2947]
MTSHSEDLSTDISSSLSSPFRNSFNRKRTTTASSQVERLDEADKQILEWAGKLEMESVDLREKSSQLIQVLQGNSDDVSALVKKLDAVLAKQGHVDEFRSSISELGSQLSTLEKLAKESQKSCKGANGHDRALKKMETNIMDALDTKHESTTRSIEQVQELLFNIGRQLEDTHQVMTSMCKDINRLNQRQSSLEKEMKECKAAFTTEVEHSPIVPVIDDGSTLLNDGPITRSMSKRRTRGITTKKVIKPRDTAVTRTIIPWEEVEMYYASEV